MKERIKRKGEERRIGVRGKRRIGKRSIVIGIWVSWMIGRLNKYAFHLAD